MFVASNGDAGGGERAEVVLSNFFYRVRARVDRRYLRIAMVVFAFDVVAFPLVPGGYVCLVTVLRTKGDLICARICLLGREGRRKISSVED